MLYIFEVYVRNSILIAYLTNMLVIMNFNVANIYCHKTNDIKLEKVTNILKQLI